MNICPYCKKELPKEIKRKSKCPLCGEMIYVKNRPNEKNKVLVSENVAAEIDREWEAQVKENTAKIKRDLFNVNIDNLLSYQNQGIKKVEILANPDSCENCKTHNGKIYTISEALATNPLPYKDCNDVGYGFCRCTYLPVIE